jgi:hypothetical protein
MVLLPNTRLSPCPSCAELIRAGSHRCPHCDKDMSDGSGMMLCSAALLWAGLTLSGCMISAVYGVPTTSETVSAGSGGETDTASESSGDGEGTTTGPTTSGTMGGTEGQTTTGPTTGMTGSTGTSDGSGTDGSSSGTGTSGTSDQPLYGAVDPPNG